jgi:rhodanese-related sulfurtransferase
VIGVSLSSIHASELKVEFDAGVEIVLLDVREDDERKYCAIPAPSGVLDLHIPMRQIPSRVDELATVGGRVVVYCHHGVRSMVVARWLAGRGVGCLLNLEGGIDAWAAEVEPGMPRY